MTKTKNIILDDYERDEISRLIKLLQDHKNKYACFKSFTTTCDDAINIAYSLLNNQYNIFKRYKLKYSNHTAKKMRGIKSLSTYKKTSSICNYLSLHDGICKKCYAEKSIKLYEAALLPLLIYNTLLLKYIDIDTQQIDYINDKYFRFESFSDLQGSKHLSNLIKVCKKNKNTIFTLWTKAGMHLKKMMDDENIKHLPANINIVYSEYKLNNKTDAEYLNSMQSVLNTSSKIKCFIVYDDENKRKNSGMYLCKNRCIDCLKCYKKSKDIIYIAEKIH